VREAEYSETYKRKHRDETDKHTEVERVQQRALNKESVQQRKRAFHWA
jgi:hypothetical protein